MQILKVTLKQHTPLLHFQPNEPNATLRASEVKPKLDKYIIEQIGGGSYEKVKGDVKKEYKDLFINKDNIYALDYSLRIDVKDIDLKTRISEADKPKIKEDKETHKKETYYLLKNFPLILSNLGGKTDRDKLANLSYTQYPIELIFIIKNKGKETVNGPGFNLYDIIKKYIVLFFAKNNFGQRSNKGFGSFTVSKINDQSVPLHMPFNFYISYNNDNKNNRFITLFTVIDYYWKSLKSGINYTKRKVNQFDGTIFRDCRKLYHKSYLYQYLNKPKIKLTWEKRVVKQQLRLESVKLEGDPQEQPNNNSSFFARAHLGYPIDKITYKKMTGKILKRYNRKDGKEEVYESFEQIDVDISSNKQSVQRIPSPIIFKPIFDGAKVIIYILFDQKIIESIKNTIPEDLMFTFTRKEEQEELKVSVPMFVKRGDEKYIIDYADLIKSFHESFEKKSFVVMNAQKNKISVELS